MDFHGPAPVWPNQKEGARDGDERDARAWQRVSMTKTVFLLPLSSGDGSLDSLVC